MNPLLAAHPHTQNNRVELDGSRQCGCCACMAIFPVEEIVAWSGLDLDSLDNPDTASAETALCPRCGAEAVLGDRAGFPITPDFLMRMNQAWFQRTIIRRPTPKP